jgi:hypothetical protein
MTWDESQGLPRHKCMPVKQLVDGWCTAHACTLLGGDTKEPHSDGVVGLAHEQVQLLSPMGRRYVRRRPSYASAGPSARSHVTLHKPSSSPRQKVLLRCDNVLSDVCCMLVEARQHRMLLFTSEGSDELNHPKPNLKTSKPVTFPIAYAIPQ